MKRMRSAVVELLVLVLGVVGVGGAKPACRFPSSNAECSLSAIMQMVVVEDISHSYNNDLQGWIDMVPSLIGDLECNFWETKVGVASFSDKGIEPLGYDEDYCYRRDLALTTDASAVSTALNGLDIISGNDYRESQLDAIKYTIKDDGIGWTRSDFDGDRPVMRLVVVATDSLPHIKGDAGHLPDDTGDCKTEDYPSMSDMIELIQAYNFYPLIVATSDIYSKWNELVSDWPNVGVVEIAGDIPAAMLELVERFCDSLPTTTAAPTSTLEPTTAVPSGCGASSTVYGASTSTCAALCSDIEFCDDESTTRINSSNAECLVAAQYLLGDISEVEVVELLSVATGCNLDFGSLDDPRAMLKLNGPPYGCDAARATQPAGNHRLCCCNYG